jgi:hypothetical protein
MKTKISRDLELIAQKLGLKLRELEQAPLEGLWEDLMISDRDIEEAKKAVSGEH